MNKSIFLILIAFFTSCKKEIPASKATPKPNKVIAVQKIDEKKIAIDTLLIQKYNSKLLSSFYKLNSNKTVWLSSNNRKLVLDALGNSATEGLEPNDYDIATLKKYEFKTSSLTNDEWIQYDLLLTNSLQKYISHLTNGKLNPTSLYEDWDLKPNQIDLNETINQIQKGDSVAEKLEALKPNYVVYKRLKKALQLINSYPKASFESIVIAGKIVPNDSVASIIEIKKRLIYWKDLKAEDSLTLNYDEATVLGVKKFQLRHGLAADGIIGKGTISALNFTRKNRREQIIANLERWKWYPRNMGKEYLIINIPAYQLNLIKNQDTIRTHKVIVGQIKRKTPVLSSRLSHAIFNPTWTIPPTILKEDVIPSILKNRNYLAKTNIKIYDASGNNISASNWQASKANTYRYVQTPGTYNSLGMVKLMFPNRFSVYLHDTNHRDYFDKTDRSISSGCVRVENPLELTAYLIDNPIDWSLEKITETLESEKTKQVNIKKEINIHLLYWTAWSVKNTLIFRDDIYNLDADLYYKLRN